MYIGDNKPFVFTMLLNNPPGGFVLKFELPSIVGADGTVVIELGRKGNSPGIYCSVALFVGLLGS